MTYYISPLFQKIKPNINPMAIVKMNRTELYAGFLQYDQYCFQKQAFNCTKNGWEYLVGKNKLLEPGVGVLASLISSWILLRNVNIKKIKLHIYKLNITTTSNTSLKKKSPVKCRVGINLCKIYTKLSLIWRTANLKHPCGRIISNLDFWNPLNSLKC